MTGEPMTVQQEAQLVTVLEELYRQEREAGS